MNSRLLLLAVSALVLASTGAFVVVAPVGSLSFVRIAAATPTTVTTTTTATATATAASSSTRLFLADTWEGESSSYSGGSGSTGSGASSSSSSAAGSLERLEFKIYPDGRVEETVHGIKGGQCLSVTEKINKVLGEVVQTAPTEEMYEQQIVTDQTLYQSTSTTTTDWESGSSW